MDTNKDHKMSDKDFKDFETLESHISKQQKLHINSRGTFSNILRRIGVASKIITAKVQKAGLIDILGSAQNINIQGEEQIKAVKEILPDLDTVVDLGGKVFKVGRYFSEDYAEAVCNKYIALGLYSDSSRIQVDLSKD